MSWVEDEAYHGAYQSWCCTAGRADRWAAWLQRMFSPEIVTPSGKLTDTIARSIEDYPSSSNFGGREENIYQEDIYVGYRYFETFCPEKSIISFRIWPFLYRIFTEASGRIVYHGKRTEMYPRTGAGGEYRHEAGQRDGAALCQRTPRGPLENRRWS